MGLLIWLGTVLGLEIGSRMDYPRILMAICGSVFGLALSMAIYFTSIEISSAKLFLFFGVSVWRIMLIFVWSVAIGISVWLITRSKKQPRQSVAEHRSRAQTPASEI